PIRRSSDLERGRACARDVGIDRTRRENVVDDHRAGTEDARAGAGLGGDDLKTRRGQGERPLVDDLAYACEQELAGLGELAAEHDDRGVQQAHAGGEHGSDVAAGLSYGVDG